jgi:hypothetical protein
MGEIVSKGRFAELCNVSPGRVSQWISEGKLSGAAIVGTGRSAQIDVDLGKAQVKASRDVDQAHSGNGLATNLESDAPRLPLANTVTDQIAEQRLELLKRQNREKETDEFVRNGHLVEADDARRHAGQEVARAITRFEGALPEFANAIAAKFKVPARDVLHELKARWRTVRAAGAVEARERAEPMPERVGFDIDPDREC